MLPPDDQHVQMQQHTHVWLVPCPQAAHGTQASVNVEVAPPAASHQAAVCAPAASQTSSAQHHLLLTQLDQLLQSLHGLKGPGRPGAGPFTLTGCVVSASQQCQHTCSVNWQAIDCRSQTPCACAKLASTWPHKLACSFKLCKAAACCSCVACLCATEFAAAAVS